MATLIQRQDEAIQKMQEPRSSEKRATRHRRSVLNKYVAQSLRLGYTEEQAMQQRRDIIDMYELLQVSGEQEV